LVAAFVMRFAYGDMHMLFFWKSERSEEEIDIKCEGVEELL